MRLFFVAVLAGVAVIPGQLGAYSVDALQHPQEWQNDPAGHWVLLGLAIVWLLVLIAGMVHVATGPS